jgi:thiaminase
LQQDFLYIVHQCQYEADRGLKATNATDFGISMDKVVKRANYGKELLKTCTDAPPTGLGIADSVVLATPATTALKNYIALLIAAANEQNWVMSLVATVPCIQVSHPPFCAYGLFIGGSLTT